MSSLFKGYKRIWPLEINDNRLALCATKAKLLEYTANMNYEPEPEVTPKPRKIKPFWFGEKKQTELQNQPNFIKIQKEADANALEYLKKMRVSGYVGSHGKNKK